MTAADEGLSSNTLDITIEAAVPSVSAEEEFAKEIDAASKVDMSSLWRSDVLDKHLDHTVSSTISQSHSSSPLSSLSSTPSPSITLEQGNCWSSLHQWPTIESYTHFLKGQATVLPCTRTPTHTPPRGRSLKCTPKFSRFFPKPAAEKISCIPFPPLNATSFGLVQEGLCHDPFRLLVAVMFLNKTRGTMALPVCYKLFDQYPTPADLASADVDKLVELIHRLGLQNQRAVRMIKLAKVWVENPPQKGKRYRRLHYPGRDDGKDIQKDTGPIADNDPRTAWEIAHLPGAGAYAMDSWRIFCRDELRGLPTGIPHELTPQAIELELQKEWTTVLPLDKELRAYLRWRWLRLGWQWNPLTGERKRLEPDVYEKVEAGGIAFEGDEHWSLEGANTTLGRIKTESAAEPWSISNIDGCERHDTREGMLKGLPNLSENVQDFQGGGVVIDELEATDTIIVIQERGQVDLVEHPVTHVAQAERNEETARMKRPEAYRHIDRTTCQAVQAALDYLNDEAQQQPSIKDTLSVLAKECIG